MKTIIKILFVVLVSSFSLNSQVSQVWVSRTNGAANFDDNLSSMVLDNSGNIYVTGTSEDQAATDIDYLTVKYNSAGVQQWAVVYDAGDDAEDIATAIAVDNTGNVYVTGTSYFDVTFDDIVTIKYNAAGVQQWITRYTNGAGGHPEEGHSITTDNSGNIYVTGKAYESGMGGNNIVTIKYNSAGVQQWAIIYNGPGNTGDSGESIILDNAGNICVTGYSMGSGTAYDCVTIKYNSGGTQLWLQRYNGPGNLDDFPVLIKADNSGNVYITGSTRSSMSDPDYATIKYNSSGVQQWAARYDGPGSDSLDFANSLAIDPAGNVYVTGESGSLINPDYATVKYNSNGVQQWAQRYNGTGNSYDYGHSIAVDISGNVFITGSSIGSGTGLDCATIMYNNSGVQQWLQGYNGPGNSIDGGLVVAVDNAGNVIVGGGSTGSGTGNDYTVIKYNHTIGIQQINNEIQDNFSLLQNYPNPFNPTTNIHFAIPRSSFVKLIVYDMLGREVETLVNENLSAGTYNADWNAANYSSGVYFYKLETENFTETKKMLLIK